MPHRALVWLLDADALSDGTLAAYAAWLDATERRRLERFVRPARRRQFLTGRVLARLALAEVLGIGAKDVRLEDRPGAAPLLAAPADEVAGFSISHSGRWVACAASVSSKLGLDIEVVDPARDIDALAAQAFDEGQLAWLAARPPATRLRDFYGLWSLAEAQFKLGRLARGRFDLSTPALAIVLCSEQALGAAPEVEIKTLGF